MLPICFVYALYMLCIWFVYGLYMLSIWWSYGGVMVSLWWGKISIMCFFAFSLAVCKVLRIFAFLNGLPFGGEIVVY